MLVNVIRSTSRRLYRLAAGQPEATHPRWSKLSAGDLSGPPPIFITAPIANRIRRTIGARPAESGGALGGVGPQSVINAFHFDSDAATTGATYRPNVDEINRLLREDWKRDGKVLLGFVHSHPFGATRPSQGDLNYAERILAVRPRLDRLCLPIVQTMPDAGRFGIHGAAAVRDGRKIRLEQCPFLVIPERSDINTPDDAAWDRVHDAYDLDAMARTRLVVVGCGGSAAFVEDMTRCGIGEIVLIDPDIVARPNIATQQVYRSDLGRPKVEALAERLLDVSRHLRVASIHAALDDLDDAAMSRLLNAPLPHGRIGSPDLTILCGFTDSFWAQGRVNRLALNHGVAQLHAGVYKEGRGVELFYSIPGRSHACSRCVLHSRYDQYLHRGFENDVTSRGTPLLATNRLNELKSIVTLAIVHGTSPGADASHPATRRWSSALDYLAGRNFVQVGLEPLDNAVLDLRIFRSVASLDQRGRIGLDQTVWHEKSARHGCSDCGGTGDLRSAIGSIPSTVVEPALLKLAR